MLAYYDEDNANGFTIHIDSSQSQDVTFSWHAFASSQAMLTVTGGTTQAINLSVSSAPPATGPSQDPEDDPTPTAQPPPDPATNTPPLPADDETTESAASDDAATPQPQNQETSPNIVDDSAGPAR